MSGVVSIPLSDAKANLSSIIHSVRDAGDRYTITLHNKPVAMVVPIPQGLPAKSMTRGILSNYANEVSREQESSAFAKAMETKHANTA